MRFDGPPHDVAPPDLRVVVDGAITLERPLLVRGESGTGKTVLAGEITEAVGAPLIEWGVKSTAKAQQDVHLFERLAFLARREAC